MSPKVLPNQRRRFIWSAALTVISTLAVMSLSALEVHAQPGSHVRGAVVRRGLYGTYPVTDVRVTLLRPDNGLRSSPVYTDKKGLYYFYNVPPGRYEVEVWDYRYDRYKPIVTRSVEVQAGSNTRSYTFVPDIEIP